MVSRYGDARSVVGGLRMGATIPIPNSSLNDRISHISGRPDKWAL